MTKQDMELIVNKYPEKMKPIFQEILKIIGFEGLYQLSQEFGGAFVYVPLQSRLFAGCIAEEIRYEYNGDNIRQLSKKYNMTQAQIRRILFEHTSG